MTLIAGDCLEKLTQIPDNSVDLVYMDPPFFTQKKAAAKNKR
ncbi:hypothetical protein [Domibacillus antri]|nr:hypothetical protein [Domibacillus antri]